MLSVVQVIAFAIYLMHAEGYSTTGCINETFTVTCPKGEVLKSVQRYYEIHASSSRNCVLTKPCSSYGASLGIEEYGHCVDTLQNSCSLNLNQLPTPSYLQGCGDYVVAEIYYECININVDTTDRHNMCEASSTYRNGFILGGFGLPGTESGECHCNLSQHAAQHYTGRFDIHIEALYLPELTTGNCTTSLSWHYNGGAHEICSPWSGYYPPTLVTMNSATDSMRLAIIFNFSTASRVILRYTSNVNQPLYLSCGQGLHYIPAPHTGGSTPAPNPRDPITTASPGEPTPAASPGEPTPEANPGRPTTGPSATPPSISSPSIPAYLPLVLSIVAAVLSLIAINAMIVMTVMTVIYLRHERTGAQIQRSTDQSREKDNKWPGVEHGMVPAYYPLKQAGQ